MLALDILCVCSVMPVVQAALCEKIPVPLADEPMLDCEVRRGGGKEGERRERKTNRQREGEDF